jgi:single-strand selective monofunctional uracil DNA glycosylase
MVAIALRLVRASRRVSRLVGALRFTPPVAYVYNPLDYARAPHELYLRKFGGARRRVLFLGMNPGPFGMAQTGVPFGEVAAVRNWLGIAAKVGQPATPHPKRPVEGFNCARSEVSGRRLWALFAQRFGTPRAFFKEHFVANYCPLAFMDAGGRNLTPDKLCPTDTSRLFTACDAHLREVAAALQPGWVIGIGGFAEGRARIALHGAGVKFGRMLHPSPASPAANRGWAEAATEQLRELGVW